jgi:hypothetical protein
MDRDVFSLSNIASFTVHFDTAHINLGPAPDLILVHFRAVSVKATGPYLGSASLAEGYEDAEFRADGVVTYRASYFLTVDGVDPLLLTYSGMSEVGEDAYEHMLDDHLPVAAAIDASALFFTSALKHRWLNKLPCRAYGVRDYRRSLASCDLIAIASNPL